MRIVFALLLGLIPAMGQACGADTDCSLGDRSYRIALPEGVANPGALIYAHGYRGSAAGAMRNGGLQRLAHDNGMALIALNALNGSWTLPNGPNSMDASPTFETDYIEAVLNDAEARFGLNRANVVATGFSAGGMLTWQLACMRSDLIRAAIPMSGTFWTPVPTTCRSPAVSLVHIHGDADRTVPLGGRAIRETSQGDVPTAIGMYAQHGGFGAPTRVTPGDLTCDLRENAAGEVLGFCMFEGGHGFGIGRLRAALGMIE